jgi:hypothetical protein
MKLEECYCIKVPQGFTQNHQGETFILGKKYYFDIYPSKDKKINLYRLYQFKWDTPVLIRESEWFWEYFGTIQTIREKKIIEIFDE